MSALSRVQRTAQGWDFSADVSAAEEFARQPLVGYALDQELHAAVDTVPDLVKLPGKVGSAQLLELLPRPLSERYAEEHRVVLGFVILVYEWGCSEKFVVHACVLAFHNTTSSVPLLRT